MFERIRLERRKEKIKRAYQQELANYRKSQDMESLEIAHDLSKSDLHYLQRDIYEWENRSTDANGL